MENVWVEMNDNNKILSFRVISSRAVFDVILHKDPAPILCNNTKVAHHGKSFRNRATVLYKLGTYRVKKFDI